MLSFVLLEFGFCFLLFTASYGAFLLDMDGVLHRHQHPIEGAKEFLQLLQDRKLPYLLLTNEDRFTKEGESRGVDDVFVLECVRQSD